MIMVEKITKEFNTILYWDDNLMKFYNILEPGPTPYFISGSLEYNMENSEEAELRRKEMMLVH